MVIVVQLINDDISSMECLLAEDFYLKLKPKHCSLRQFKWFRIFHRKNRERVCEIAPFKQNLKWRSCPHYAERRKPLV